MPEITLRARGILGLTKSETEVIDLTPSVCTDPLVCDTKYAPMIPFNAGIGYLVVLTPSAFPIDVEVQKDHIASTLNPGIAIGDTTCVFAGAWPGGELAADYTKLWIDGYLYDVDSIVEGTFTTTVVGDFPRAHAINSKAMLLKTNNITTYEIKPNTNTLDGAILSGALTLTLNLPLQAIPDAGVILIDDEEIMYLSRSGGSSENLDDLIRGWNGTTAAAHANDAIVILQSSYPVITADNAYALDHIGVSYKVKNAGDGTDCYSANYAITELDTAAGFNVPFELSGIPKKCGLCEDTNIYTLKVHGTNGDDFEFYKEQTGGTWELIGVISEPAFPGSPVELEINLTALDAPFGFKVVVDSLYEAYINKVDTNNSALLGTTTETLQGFSSPSIETKDHYSVNTDVEFIAKKKIYTGGQFILNGRTGSTNNRTITTNTDMTLFPDQFIAVVNGFGYVGFRKDPTPGLLHIGITPAMTYLSTPGNSEYEFIRANVPAGTIASFAQPITPGISFKTNQIDTENLVNGIVPEVDFPFHIVPEFTSTTGYVFSIVDPRTDDSRQRYLVNGIGYDQAGKTIITNQNSGDIADAFGVTDLPINPDFLFVQVPVQNFNAQSTGGLLGANLYTHSGGAGDTIIEMWGVIPGLAPTQVFTKLRFFNNNYEFIERDAELIASTKASGAVKLISTGLVVEDGSFASNRYVKFTSTTYARYEISSALGVTGFPYVVALPHKVGLIQTDDTAVQHDITRLGDNIPVRSAVIEYYSDMNDCHLAIPSTGPLFTDAENPTAKKQSLLGYNNTHAFPPSGPGPAFISRNGDRLDICDKDNPCPVFQV